MQGLQNVTKVQATLFVLYYSGNYRNHGACYYSTLLHDRLDDARDWTATLLGGSRTACNTDEVKICGR